MDRNSWIGAVPLLWVLLVDAVAIGFAGDLMLGPPGARDDRPLVTMAVIAAIACFATIPNALVRGIVASLLFVSAIVGGFSIGLFYLPAAIVAAYAAARADAAKKAAAANGNREILR